MSAYDDAKQSAGPQHSTSYGTIAQPAPSNAYDAPTDCIVKPTVGAAANVAVYGTAVSAGQGLQRSTSPVTVSPVLRIVDQYAANRTATAVDQELEAELQQLSPPELRHVIRVLADNSDENQRSRTQDIASHLHAYIAHRSMETASGSGSAGGKAATKTSSFDSPVKERARNWNEEFQTIVGSFEDDTILEEEQKFIRLSGLAQDFLAIAKETGRTIITEKHWPLDLKTIKPLSKMGIAGGEKYMSRGVFFKFAIDHNKLYGSDEHAAKAAGLELLALSKLYQCNEPELFLPLMSLIDYRGYRLVAVSTLPLSKQTLRYGSSDGGRNILNTDPAFVAKMTNVAKKLGLKEHELQPSDGGPRVRMHGPFDMEGHAGEDGRHYCLDFARLFPPEPPLQQTPYINRATGEEVKNPWLWRLLRPELISEAGVPLNCDAYVSTLAPNKDQIKQDQQDIESVHQVLLEKSIPAFAAWLEAHKPDGPEYAQLSTHMHHFGVNVRYLGLVRSHVKDTAWRVALFCEIAARTLKQLLRGRFRRLVSELQAKSSSAVASGSTALTTAQTEQFTAVAVQFLNVCFGENAQSKAFWKDTVWPEIAERRFKGTFSDAEVEVLKARSPKALLYTSNTALANVFLRLCSSMEIQLDPDLAEFLSTAREPKQIERFFKGVAPVKPDHVLGLKEAVKQLPIVSYAEGTVLLVRAFRMARMGLPEMARPLARRAQAKYDVALAYSYDDPSTLANCSFLYQNVYVPPRPDDSLRVLQRSVQANPFHARSWYYLALRYDKDEKNPEKGKEHYLKAIEVSQGRHANSLKDLANLYRFIKKDLPAAEQYYRLALKAKPLHAKALFNLGSMLLVDVDQPDFDEGFLIIKQSACLPDPPIQMGTNHKFFFSSLCRLRAELCFLLKPSTVSSVQPYPLPDASDYKVSSSAAVNASQTAPYLLEADACMRLACAFAHTTPVYTAYADFLCRYMQPPDLDKAEYMYLKAIEMSQRERDISRDVKHEVSLQGAIMVYAEFLYKHRKDNGRASDVFKGAIASFQRHTELSVAYAEFLQQEMKDTTAATACLEEAIATAGENNAAHQACIRIYKTQRDAMDDRSSPAYAELTAKLQAVQKSSKSKRAFPPVLLRGACANKKCRSDKGQSGLLCVCYNLKRFGNMKNYPFKRSVWEDKQCRDMIMGWGMGPPAKQLCFMPALAAPAAAAVTSLARLYDPNLSHSSPYGYATAMAGAFNADNTDAAQLGDDSSNAAPASLLEGPAAAAELKLDDPMFAPATPASGAGAYDLVADTTSDRGRQSMSNAAGSQPRLSQVGSSPTPAPQAPQPVLAQQTASDASPPPLPPMPAAAVSAPAAAVQPAQVQQDQQSSAVLTQSDRPVLDQSKGAQSVQLYKQVSMALDVAPPAGEAKAARVASLGAGKAHQPQGQVAPKQPSSCCVVM